MVFAAEPQKKGKLVSGFIILSLICRELLSGIKPALCDEIKYGSTAVGTEELHCQMGTVKISGWLPPSVPTNTAGSLFTCLPAGISLPTSGHRHQRFQKSLLRKM